jgi:dienelactone hydrolase
VLLFNVPSRFSFNPWQWPDGIRSAIDYLSCQSSDLIDLNRIGAMGHSMGGLGVLIAGSLDSRIKCAVCLAPPVHVNLFYLPKRFGIPIQLQIGIRDKLVPAEKVKAFYADLSAVEKEIVEISGGNHVQFMDLPLGGFLDNRATVSVKEQHSASGRGFITWFDRYLKP